MKKRQKILIVDDSQLSRHVDAFLLEGIDADIVMATSGEEAIQKTYVEDFDLILMDVIMPGIDGFEAVRTIRKEEKNRLIPTIFITSVPGDELRMVKGLSLGAIDFMTKPISKEIFFIKVNNLLELQKNRKELEFTRKELEQKIEEMELLILEREKAETELARYREHLEETIRVRTAALEDEIAQHRSPVKVISSSERELTELIHSANSVIIKWKPDGTIVFANDYALMLFHYNREELIGNNVKFLVPEKSHNNMDLSVLLKNIAGAPENYIINENENITKDGEFLWIVWSNGVIKDYTGQVKEILSIGTDNTCHKKMEIELAEARLKAEEASVNIKILKGLLPICANCKKIRDDKGYWNQVETYIQKHSDTTFSHSLCPECARKLYPDIDFENYSDGHNLHQRND